MCYGYLGNFSSSDGSDLYFLVMMMEPSWYVKSPVVVNVVVSSVQGINLLFI